MRLNKSVLPKKPRKKVKKHQNNANFEKNAHSGARWSAIHPFFVIFFFTIVLLG